MNRASSAEWWRPDAVAETARERAAGAAETQGAAPFWALMAFTFIMLISPQAFFPVLTPLRLALVSAALAAATYFWHCLIHRRPLSIRAREIWIVAGLAVWVLITIPLSYAPERSAAIFFDDYSKTLLLFWLLCNVVSSVKKFGRVFWAFSLMAIPLAATGIEHFFSGVFSGPASDRIAGYEAALTGNPNDLALMLNLMLPLTVALLQIHRGGAVRTFLLGVLCLTVTAIILTFSRGGFLTMAALLLIYLWKFRRRPQRRWIWGLVAFLLVCIPLVGPAYLDRLATITDVPADMSGSAQQRWSDMAAALSYTVKHPLIGAGIGQNIKAVQEERGPDGFLVHNVYLEYAVELGLPGLILFLLLLAGCLKSAALAQKRSRGVPRLREFFYLAEGIQVSLVAFAVAAMFHPLAYHFQFYYLGGLAVAAKAVAGAERRYGHE